MLQSPKDPPHITHNSLPLYSLHFYRTLVSYVSLESPGNCEPHLLIRLKSQILFEYIAMKYLELATPA